jgi:alpha-tubulin suppressor-like RCC1 family protein
LTTRAWPVAIDAPSATVDVAAGEWHTCALTAAGTVHCWGANDVDQLGVPGVDSLPAPGDAIAGLPAISAVACGESHTCALTRVGGVVCWGDGGDGQLGGVVTAPTATPRVVALPCDEPARQRGVPGP